MFLHGYLDHSNFSNIAIEKKPFQVLFKALTLISQIHKGT